MNNNDNKRELTYNEAKALLARMYSDKQEQNNGLDNNPNNANVEFSEELAKNNNFNNEQNNKNKSNNMKKTNR